MVEAGDARTALSAKAIDKPDLVLLDLGLPDRDGVDLDLDLDLDLDRPALPAYRRPAPATVL